MMCIIFMFLKHFFKCNPCDIIYQGLTELGSRVGKSFFQSSHGVTSFLTERPLCLLKDKTLFSMEIKKTVLTSGELYACVRACVRNSIFFSSLSIALKTKFNKTFDFIPFPVVPCCKIYLSCFTYTFMLD